MKRHDISISSLAYDMNPSLISHLLQIIVDLGVDPNKLAGVELGIQSQVGSICLAPSKLVKIALQMFSRLIHRILLICRLDLDSPLDQYKIVSC